MTRRRKQNTNIQKVIQKLFREFWKLAASFTNSLLDWLMRGLLITGTRQQRQQKAKAGFILPTVTMLLVVVALVIGSILLRTGSRTNQVISERNQQIIYNAATPAVDRAKAKLEFLFRQDDRLPQGTPSESRLMSMLLNDGQNNVEHLDTNPYKLQDETQLDLDGGGLDPAWSFKMDTNADGSPDTTVAYSIVFKTRDPLVSDENDPNPPPPAIDRTKKDKEKAAKLVVRNGPIIAEDTIDPGCQRLNLQPEAGWDLAGTATLLKTFQVNAVVVSNQGAGNRTIVTQEYQQDRELARGNRWGAWFRDDLHLYPGDTFNWNGAMHTEGSLMVGGSNTVTGFLISSPKSCVYDPKSNSEITIRRITPDTQTNNQSLPEFYGQMVNGDLANDTTGTTGSKFHIQAASPDESSANVAINEQKDSVISGNPSQIALDPVKLFTEDISQSRDPDDRSNKNRSVAEWRRADNPKISNDRIKAISDSKPPYVDDTYRADDRLGPKPRYRIGEGIDDVTLSPSRQNGTKIDSAGLTGEQVTRLTTNTVLPTDTQYKKLGLDGYWERRAKLEGLRIIVGQRLELGNPFGWEGNNDPLYPLYDDSTLPNPIPHQQQQRRTLRDNLAAVQATAVYHQGQGNSDQPVACVATTAHPGTNYSILQSRNFSTQNGQLLSNFFTGKGTNGWEYQPPSDPNLGGKWNDALNNLARFAGEVDGAFPPIKQDRVYPYSYLSMWGNFSNLRRAMDPSQFNNSIADNSYKQTAACTMGMLARNIEDIRKKVTDDVIATNPFSTWATRLESPTPALPTNPTADNLFDAVSTDQTQQQNARLYSLFEQIKRDRKYGFAPIPSAPSGDPEIKKYQYRVQFVSSYPFGGITYKNTTPTPTASPPEKQDLSLSCNIDTGTGGNNYFGLGAPSTWGTGAAAEDKEKQFIRLAVTLCSNGRPKFPSLYYLFPTQNHGRGITGNPDNIDNTELYISKTNSRGISTGGDFAAFNDGEIASIALTAQNNLSDFKVPAETNSPDPSLRPNALGIFTRGANTPTNTTGTWPNFDGYVSLLDSGIFDGREMMSLRVLDLDLQLLRNKSFGSDRWLPNSGIIYAFREDAVREDAISRPGSGDYTDPNNPIRTNATNPNDPKDPNLKENKVSPKPVDFYPDPDRRPYGFRLRNGSELSRPDIPGKYTQRGLTFISDNSVFIQGDFNKHSQQEFNDTNGFYNRSDLNTNFATSANDTWRPSEILADAITLLSKDFRDGNIASGLSGVEDLPPSASGRSKQHSYRAQNSTDDRSEIWVREDGSAVIGNDWTKANAAIPIKIFRDGNPKTCSGFSLIPCTPAPTPPDVNVNFATQNRRDKLNKAVQTQINATLVSGIVPARRKQGNGGFQNFPRFLEHWGSVNMGISGSFIQLNFSTAATAPFEQEAWEPDAPLPSSDDQYRWYYEPPSRVWGYDVGLQYAPAGPVSRRLVPVGAPRSEFYEEPKANDPYVCMLRKAIAGRETYNEPSPIVEQECQPVP